MCETISGDAGQIRTNQFINDVTFTPGRPPTYNSPGRPPETTVNPNDWMLREFRTLVLNHAVRIDPDTTKTTPGSNLFKSSPPVPGDPRLAILVQAIHDQIAGLLGGQKSGQFNEVGDINAIQFFTLKQGPNAYESDETIQGEGDIVQAYGGNNPNLNQDIQNDLKAVNAPGAIAAANIVDRSEPKRAPDATSSATQSRRLAATPSASIPREVWVAAHSGQQRHVATPRDVRTPERRGAACEITCPTSANARLHPKSPS